MADQHSPSEADPASGEPAPGSVLGSTQIGRAGQSKDPEVAATPGENTSDADLAPNTQVGEYRIGRKLGEGGMGTVYAAEHPAIGKRVAIKVLASRCATKGEFVRRFMNEARAVNIIRHPNIIDIFSFGTLSDGRPYFVMKYIEGESLADAIDHQHLRSDEIRRLLRQICGALQASHSAGIVHRDLKPENVWIARPPHGDSYVKLLDFGIAKLVDSSRVDLTRTGAVMGTPLCMAPEQWMGLPSVDARADIYAMGVMLYRIFAGEYPFSGTTPTELAVKHVKEAPSPPSSLQRIAPELETLILECLAKDPADRPATVDNLYARLENALATLPQPGVQATTVWEVNSDTSGSEIANGPLRSRTVARVVLAAGLFTLGGAAIGIALRPKGEPADAQPAELAVSRDAGPMIPSSTASTAIPGALLMDGESAFAGSKPPSRPHPSKPSPAPGMKGTLPAEPISSTPRPSLEKLAPAAAAPIDAGEPSTLRTRAHEKGLLEHNPLRAQ